MANEPELLRVLRRKLPTPFVVSPTRLLERLDELDVYSLNSADESKNPPLLCRSLWFCHCGRCELRESMGKTQCV
jgi:hypothetical protein